MVSIAGRVLLIIVAAQLLIGCNSSRFPSGELVMFTSVGPHAFEGSVFVVRADGSSKTTVLSPKPTLGYEAAYGNSLKSFILVSAVQPSGTTGDTVSITRYLPGMNLFLPLQRFNRSCLPAGKALEFLLPTSLSL